VVGLGGSGIELNKRIIFDVGIVYFGFLSVKMCPWYNPIQTPDDLPVSGISERCPGKRVANFMQLQISQKADDKKLIDLFCTTTQFNTLTTCAVKVVVGCNNNVRGFHKNLITIWDLSLPDFQ